MQDIESLLVTLILDERINGRIDQVSQSLELHHCDHGTANLLRQALLQGASEILHLNQAISRSGGTCPDSYKHSKSWIGIVSGTYG